MTSSSKPSAQPFNGVALAILNSRLEGIVRKMANTLLRTGRSGVLNTARDFSCCILTANDELLTTAESLPIHVLSGPDLMARALREFHPELRPGDAFLHNSPYHGNSHPADHTILMPVVDARGIHRFTVLAKAHQADCGNSLPTTYMGAARDVYEEGALIFPAVKVQEQYEIVQDIVRMCRMRIRVPEQWWGDFLAMLGAARIGEREMLALGGDVGWDRLEEFSRAMFDYSEHRMIAAIRKLRSGEVTASSTHDAFPGTPPEGIRITVTVRVDAASAMIEVDLRNNRDSLACGLNLSEACARTSAMVGIFNSIDHTVPKNAGSFRRIHLLLRDGSIAGGPKHPTSCSVATTNLADRVASSVQRAFAEMADGAGMAEAGAVIPPSIGVISGRDPRSGQAFVNQVFLGITGGAASPTEDAWLTICHAGNAGLCFLDSIEVDEIHHPIRVVVRRLLPDSEGAGRFRGAPSMCCEYGPVDCAIEVGYVSDGTINGPLGARGGFSGATAEQYRRGIDGSLVPLPACAQVHLDPGEMIVSITCGGGGYGPPGERDPGRVKHDVDEGWISRERATQVYGVVFTEAGELDSVGTAERRRAMATERHGAADRVS